MSVTPLDLSKLRVFPLSVRQNLTRADEIVVDPEAPVEPCSARAWFARWRMRPQRSGGAVAWGGRHADLRRALAPQRRRPDSRADDGRRMADSPGHQRRRHDPRLGICLARRVDRERREERGDRDLRHLARDGDEHPSGAHGRRARRAGLRPGAGPVYPRRRNERCPTRPSCSRRSPPSRGIRSRRPAPTCCGR